MEFPFDQALQELSQLFLGVEDFTWFQNTDVGIVIFEHVLLRPATSEI